MSFIIVNPTDKPIQLGGVSLPPKTPYEVQSLDNIQGWADAVASKSLTSRKLLVPSIAVVSLIVLKPTR